MVLKVLNSGINKKPDRSLRPVRFKNDTLLYSDEKLFFDKEKRNVLNPMLLKPLSIKAFKKIWGGQIEPPERLSEVLFSEIILIFVVLKIFTG